MLVNYDIEERRRGKMKSDDRVLVLKAIDGMAVATDGSIDKRLFKGENNLHAIYDVNAGNWKMAYDMGGLPGGLQGRFTTFGELVNIARAYYKKRNVEIVEIRE